VRAASRGVPGSTWSARTSGAARPHRDSVFIRIHNRLTQSVARGDRGATAVEYGLIIVFIAGAIVLALTVMGHTVSNAIANVIKGF
jgi:Flp pilus assembly pilin Flp